MSQSVVFSEHSVLCLERETRQTASRSSGRNSHALQKPLEITNCGKFVVQRNARSRDRSTLTITNRIPSRSRLYSAPQETTRLSITNTLAEEATRERERARSVEGVVRKGQSSEVGSIGGNQRSPPRSIHDISNGDHILGFGADLAEDHPGFYDAAYKRRRSFIADLAKKHRVDDPITCVTYTEEETRVWATVWENLSRLFPNFACKEFLNALPLFDFRADVIPQLDDINKILCERTGWKLRPVAGLLHPRDFLNGLAFKTFHSTQYIRHSSQPMYTPEPDICHELIGHIPLLSNPSFCEMAEEIGKASLRCFHSDKEIWHLTKLYWYTVEFGVVRENEQVKAFGAGVLSSYGELQHMGSGAERLSERGRAKTRDAENGLLLNRLPPDECPTDFPPGRGDPFAGREGGDRGGDVGRSVVEFWELDPFAPLPKMSYKDGYQKGYFMCDSFEDVASKLKVFARKYS